MPRVLLSLLLFISGCASSVKLTNRPRSRAPPAYTEKQVALIKLYAYARGYCQAIVDYNLPEKDKCLGDIK